MPELRPARESFANMSELCWCSLDKPDHNNFQSLFCFLHYTPLACVRASVRSINLPLPPHLSEVSILCFLFLQLLQLTRLLLYPDPEEEVEDSCHMGAQ